jgi:hypothetical protein
MCLEELLVAQLVKIFPSFCGTEKFITAFLSCSLFCYASD